MNLTQLFDCYPPTLNNFCFLVLMLCLGKRDGHVNDVMNHSHYFVLYLFFFLQLLEGAERASPFPPERVPLLVSD